MAVCQCGNNTDSDDGICYVCQVKNGKLKDVLAKDEKKERTFALRKCACGDEFKPTGPSSKYCDACKKLADTKKQKNFTTDHETAKKVKDYHTRTVTRDELKLSREDHIEIRLKMMAAKWDAILFDYMMTQRLDTAEMMKIRMEIMELIS